MKFMLTYLYIDAKIDRAVWRGVQNEQIRICREIICYVPVDSRPPPTRDYLCPGVLDTNKPAEIVCSPPWPSENRLRGVAAQTSTRFGHTK